MFPFHSVTAISKDHRGLSIREDGQVHINRRADTVSSFSTSEITMQRAVSAAVLTVLLAATPSKSLDNGLGLTPALGFNTWCVPTLIRSSLSIDGTYPWQFSKMSMFLTTHAYSLLPGTHMVATVSSDVSHAQFLIPLIGDTPSECEPAAQLMRIS